MTELSRIAGFERRLTRFTEQLAARQGVEVIGADQIKFDPKFFDRDQQNRLTLKTSSNGLPNPGTINIGNEEGKLVARSVDGRTEIKTIKAVNSTIEVTNDNEFIGLLAAPSAGMDTDAIHDNVASEISAIADVSPVTQADFLILEDNSSSNDKKSCKPQALTPVVVSTSEPSGGAAANKGRLWLDTSLPLSVAVTGARTIVTVTVDTTLDNSADVTLADTSAGDITITLFKASIQIGKQIDIKNIGVNSCTIKVVAGDALDGETEFIINQNASATLLADGSTDWLIL